MADVFERLKTAGAGMGTRDPADYSFMISVADAVLVGRRIAELEAMLRRIDAVVTWETTPLGRGFQGEIEAALANRQSYIGADGRPHPVIPLKS